MLQLQVIGNLGADAEVKTVNGKSFLSFNIGHNDTYTDQQGNKHESTTWVQCAMNGSYEKLQQYLTKGKTVFAEGPCNVRVYSSPKLRQMVGGLSMTVTNIRLVGGESDAVPRTLSTMNGHIYYTQKQFKLSANDTDSLLSMGQSNATLLDKRGQKYTLLKDGTILPPSPAPATDEVHDVNENQNSNGDLPF